MKDFRGTYSEYKDEKEKNEKNKPTPNPSFAQQSRIPSGLKEGKSTSDEVDEKKRLSYMEKRELDQLTKDIQLLEKKRDEINRIFDRADIPYDDIRLLSEELGGIIRQLEQKEYRWFELSARE